jgi:hypothetical protein
VTPFRRDIRQQTARGQLRAAPIIAEKRRGFRLVESDARL